MALKIKSISGIEDIVVSFADSANNVPAIGIVGLETSGNIEKVIEDDKVILVGQDYVGKGVITISGNEISANLNDYYNVDEVNDFLDEKQDLLLFGYDENSAISAINGSALAIPEIDLSNYYTKTETSGKEELSTKFDTKQDIIANKKDSSIPYLETANSSPSWEVIESSQINAHGTAEEGELYNIPINGRTYKVVCLNGKLWLAENYVDTTKAFYTNSTYGSYFTKSQIANAIPQGWHLPTKEEFQELITAETEHCEKYLSVDGWHQGDDYIAGTNELKLNILPGGEYNPGRQEISSEHYQARFWTSTDEILSHSTGKQRVYAIIKNYIGYNSKIINFDWDGPGSTYYFTVRLIKDDLEVPAPDGWKKFNGKNFIAIADDEGNTFKDFYLKTSAAQQLYQPKGDYASSADVTVLNTYYGLTTTGWKDISTNYYDKQAVDNMISGIGGDYVEHSELTCKIGSGNTGTSTAVLIHGKNNKTLGQCALVQGENNIAGYYSFAQGTDNIAGKGSDYPNYAALAQGWGNTAENYSLAQGNHCSATNTAFAQGDSCSADNYSFAQGNHNIAIVGASFAQGSYVTANNFGVSFGNKTSSYNYSFVEGSNASATNWSLGLGQNISAFTGSFAQGQTISAITYSLAQGSNVKASNYSIVQGQNCTAYLYSFAQGGWNCSAYNQSIAQGTNCSAKDQSFAQGENCTSLTYSFAQGKNNYANCSSLAQGGGNSAINGSVAVGIGNSASDYSFAGGSANTAKNYNFTYGRNNYLDNNGYSIVVGTSNTASGSSNCLVAGVNNFYSGGNSAGCFIAGANNFAKNDCAVAIGSANSVYNTNAIAIGISNIASADGSIAIGSGVKATQRGQIVLGRYNALSNNASDLLIVGNGQGIGYQSTNAMVVKADGLVSAVNLKTSAGQVMTEPTLTAGKQYSYTTTGWHEFTLPEVPTISAENGITAATGTGANTGKIIVGIDTTNYKLLTTAEYAELTAAVAIISANSGRWVLTPAS